MSQELARNEGAGAAAEPWTRPGARPDVKHLVDGRAVTRLLREGSPEEVLVECERPGVRIAPLEVDVRGLKVCRRQNDPFQHGRLQVRDVPRESLLDAVCVALAQRFGPRPVAAVEV